MYYPSNTSVARVQNTPTWEWIASVRLDVQEGGRSLAVYLFLGEAPEDPKYWISAPNLVGMHARYGSHRGTGIIQGCVPINDAIRRLSGLSSFDPELVEPYLKEKLQWKVQRALDMVPLELQSLEIVVFADHMSYPPDEIFPVMGERRQYNSVTYGKRGGSHDPQNKFGLD